MATYTVPGVYINETLQPTNAAGGFSADAIATFIGENDLGGPATPQLITAWSQFVKLYGPISGRQDDLPFAVYNFFANGGQQCYVLRLVRSDATAASATLLDNASTNSLILTSLAPGAWASDSSSTSRVSVSTSPSAAAGYFDLKITVGNAASPIATETFEQVTLVEADGRFAPTLVNSPTIGSKYVRAASADGEHGNPAVYTQQFLSGGADGSSSISLTDTTLQLDTIDSVLLLNLPGVSNTGDLTEVIDYAASSADRFVVVDGPKPEATDTNIDVTSDALSLVAGLPGNSYSATYTPWVWAQDPSTSVAGTVRLTAPGGAVLANYAITDATVGPWQTPAGTRTRIGGIGAFTKQTEAQLGSLNTAGVNVIRTVPGDSTLHIMGGRTLDTNFIDKYINVRRSLMYIETSIKNLTQPFIYANDDSRTWDQVTDIVSEFLGQMWNSGGLKGSSQSQAFFVVCDSSNNTSSDINAGILNVTVGVALETPAEFIVITIGQFDGGATVTEA